MGTPGLDSGPPPPGFVGAPASPLSAGPGAAEALDMTTVVVVYGGGRRKARRGAGGPRIAHLGSGVQPFLYEIEEPSSEGTVWILHPQTSVALPLLSRPLAGPLSARHAYLGTVALDVRKYSTASKTVCTLIGRKMIPGVVPPNSPGLSSIILVTQSQKRVEFSLSAYSSPVLKGEIS